VEIEIDIWIDRWIDGERWIDGDRWIDRWRKRYDIYISQL
jgi:hypothetical protein